MPQDTNTYFFTYVESLIRVTSLIAHDFHIRAEIFKMVLLLVNE